MVAVIGYPERESKMPKETDEKTPKKRRGRPKKTDAEKAAAKKARAEVKEKKRVQAEKKETQKALDNALNNTTKAKITIKNNETEGGTIKVTVDEAEPEKAVEEKQPVKPVQQSGQDGRKVIGIRTSDMSPADRDKRIEAKMIRRAKKHAERIKKAHNLGVNTDFVKRTSEKVNKAESIGTIGIELDLREVVIREKRSTQIRNLSKEDSKLLHQITCGLIAKMATINLGGRKRYVDTGSDAIRWMLQNMVEVAPKSDNSEKDFDEDVELKGDKKETVASDPSLVNVQQ